MTRYVKTLQMKHIELTEGQWERVAENALRDDDMEVYNEISNAEVVSEMKTYYERD